MLYSYFGRISGARQPPVATRRKPGYPLVSFLPAAKKDTAPIPCAEEEEKTTQRKTEWVTKNRPAREGLLFHFDRGLEPKAFVIARKRSGGFFLLYA
jgi:hypothetical protein